MRTLNGVVVLRCRKYMKIQLESGNVVTTGPEEGIRNGSQVEIAFDFTKNRVRKVRLKGKRQEFPQPAEPLGDEVNPIPKIDPASGAFSARLLRIEGWEEEAEAFVFPLGEDGD